MKLILLFYPLSNDIINFIGYKIKNQIGQICHFEVTNLAFRMSDTLFTTLWLSSSMCIAALDSHTHTPVLL